MKLLYFLGMGLFCTVSYACELVWVTRNNSDNVSMASSIASGLFFKSNCARTIESPKALTSETHTLMSNWNLIVNANIKQLTLDDILAADLVIVLSEKDKKQLDSLYPNEIDKIKSIRDCSRLSGIEKKLNLTQMRQYLFRSEDVISTNHWQCY